MATGGRRSRVCIDCYNEQDDVHGQHGSNHQDFITRIHHLRVCPRLHAVRRTCGRRKTKPILTTTDDFQCMKRLVVPLTTVVSVMPETLIDAFRNWHSCLDSDTDNRVQILRHLYDEGSMEE